MKLLICTALAFGAGLSTNAYACATDHVCYAQSVSIHPGCSFEVVVQNTTDRAKWTTFGCFKSFEAAKNAAKKLARNGKCEFVDSEN